MTNALGELWRRRATWIVVGCHVVVALLLVGVWRADDEIDVVYLSSIPCAQLSLIAMWSASARAPAWLRLPALLLGTAACAVVVLRVFQTRTPDESAGWTVALATQALLVAIAATAWRVVRFVRAHRGTQPEEAQALRYSLRTLILWITALAVLLGMGREAFARAGWTGEILKWRYFLFMPVLGAFNALYAVLVLATLLRRDHGPARLLLGLLLVGMAGASASTVLDILFGEDGNLSWPITLAWALGQAGVLYATLLPWGGGAGATDLR